ncbi:MAG: Ig-like domain-containing protein [Bacteroidales bacterium]
MKIANKYFKGSALLSLMALLVFSCTEFTEFESTTLGPGPSITLSLVSVQDSTFTVAVTSNGDGYASVILLPGSGNPIPEDPENLLTGNISSLEYQSKVVKANQATNFTFSGLYQWALYEVQSAANNADGKISEVKTLTVGTDDNHGPVLSATDPGITYDPVLSASGPITLVFDEWVLYDEDKELTFAAFFGGEEMTAGSVEVDGNVVTVTPAEDFTYRDYIWLSYPEGAFTDYAGNPTEEITTYYDEDNGVFVGLYWRVEAFTYDAVSITPAADSVDASRFDIVVTFDDAVDIDEVEDAMITLTYDDGFDVLIKGVLVSELTAIDNTLKITQTKLGVPGSTVTLNIPEGILGIGIGNPNAEITASWAIK